MTRLKYCMFGFVLGLALTFAGIGISGYNKSELESPALNFVIELNDPIPEDYIDYNQLECLAKNIYFEGRGETVEGQIAITQVVLNRVKSSLFPDDICDVVYQGPISSWTLVEKSKVVPLLHKCQFSWYCDGRSDDPRDMWAWGRSLTIAAKAMRGEYDDKTNGAMWFHNHTVSPGWNNLTEVADIGKHKFYTLN